MKFLLFADLHYSPGVFRSLGWDALRIFQSHAEEAGCDMIIHAGDFCHPTKTPDFVKAYNGFHIPSYHCLGNHDLDCCTTEEAVECYGMPSDYYYFDMGGCRFIVTNTSYFEDNGEYVAYSYKNYFEHSDTRETVPPRQIEWLAETIAASPYPCVIISHSSFERCNGVRNRSKILEVIDRANKKKPHSVLMCINGHHHRDYIRVLNNVIYFDMNSASYDWVGTPHTFFPEEECQKYKSISKTVCFNDPLHAIVTIDGTTVTIEGMESSMFMGVSRETIGAPIYDKAGREVTPRVQSAKITLG